MRTPALLRIKGYLQNANRWFFGTAERALDQAYDAALRIRALEDEHFDGEKVSRQSSRHSANVLDYFQADLKKYLNIIRVRLAEFKTSSSVRDLISNAPEGGFIDRAGRDRSTIVLEKLRFIDEVLNRYAPTSPIPKPSASVAVIPRTTSSELVEQRPINNGNRPRPTSPSMEDNNAEMITDKTGVLPRSILGTIGRIRKELDPKSEDEVVKNFRTSKAKTIISLRFLLLLILIPLLTQQISKTFVVGPLIDHFRSPETASAFLHVELEEEAYRELHLFEERLKFDQLIHKMPALSTEETEERVQTKAMEIAEVYHQRSNDAVKNVFADLISAIAFGGLLLISRREIETLKSFIDEIVYGLSDSAKAFIIILFTDIFVGFHSPHGWEVLLESICRHLGVPESREAIFLFIATFPVILDTVFKYWIFRYLNRISPSAVATYKNMNE